MADTTSAELVLGDRTIRVTNLDRVLWPEAQLTKGDLLAYYAGVAAVLLPYLRDRPLVTVRAPEGVDGRVWFQTNAHHPPPWVRTHRAPVARGGSTFEYAVVDDEATLMWALNLGTIEFHPFLARAGGMDRPDFIVLDLDPRPPAGLRDCARVALLLRDHLSARGQRAGAKTSGQNGLHVFVPVRDTSFAETKATARALAGKLAAEHPDLVVDTSLKSGRSGRVFVDWAQNNAARQMVAPYSLRATSWPFVSTPITWAEVEAATGGEVDLRFGPGDVLQRVEAKGDVFAVLPADVGESFRNGP